MERDCLLYLAWVALSKKQTVYENKVPRIVLALLAPKKTIVKYRKILMSFIISNVYLIGLQILR